MITYQHINKELERIHTETKLNYWRHLIKNEPLKSNIKDRGFFFDDKIKQFIDENLMNSANDLEKRKWSLLKGYFANKRVDLDQEISEIIETASNLMLSKAIEVDGKKFGSMELFTKSYSCEDEAEADYYRNLINEFYGKFKNTVVALVKRRNILAREEGYSSFIDLYFSNKDLTKRELTDLFQSLKGGIVERTKKELVEKTVSRNFNENNLIMSKYFCREKGKDLLNGFLCQWGIDSCYKNIQIFETEKGSAHHETTECIDVSVPDDIRVFINTDKNLSDYLFCLFHEFGHALHHSSIETKDFIFKELPGHFCEAMAGVVDKLLVLKESLGQKVGNKKDIEIMSIKVFSNNYNVFLGNIISNLFELGLYSKDMSVEEADNFYETLIKEWTGIEGRRNWGGCIIAVAKYPLYSYSYILGHVISNQIASSVYNKFGSYLKPEVFKFLKEMVYSRGNEVSYRDVLLEATGKPVDANYLFWLD